MAGAGIRSLPGQKPMSNKALSAHVTERAWANEAPAKAAMMAGLKTNLAKLAPAAGDGAAPTSKALKRVKEVDPAVAKAAAVAKMSAQKAKSLSPKGLAAHADRLRDGRRRAVSASYRNGGNQAMTDRVAARKPALDRVQRVEEARRVARLKEAEQAKADKRKAADAAKGIVRAPQHAEPAPAGAAKGSVFMVQKTTTTPASSARKDKTVVSTVTLPNGATESVRRSKEFTHAVLRNDGDGWHVRGWTRNPAAGLKAAHAELAAQRRARAE